jgi:lipoprotein-anchoring transpeptidase ErfK/SrfK
MRNRPFIAVAALLGILLAGAVGLYAFDRAGRDTVPRGVRVAGVDVGGLGAGAARARLEREFLGGLRRPVLVYHGSLTFRLGPQESRVAADLDGMVDTALAQARTGNLLTRTWRRVSGGALRVDLPARASFSEAAAVRLVDHVRAAIDRPARDARIAFSAAGLRTEPSHEGLAVMGHSLHRAVDRALADPRADHTLVATTRHVAPRVGSDELARRYATVLIVDRADFQLKLFKALKLVKTYSIAVGMIGLETPAGLYHIQNKTVDPAWTKPNSDWVPEDERGDVVPGGDPKNPLKARWLGIFAGAGIHGIDPSEYGTIGHAASHGCVRMRIDDVEDLYPRVPVGAPIYIA